MDVMLTGQSSLGQIPWSWCIGLLESQSNQTHHTKPLNSGTDVVTTSSFAGRMGLKHHHCKYKVWFWKWNCFQLLRMKILYNKDLIGPIQLVFLNSRGLGNASRIRLVYIYTDFKSEKFISYQESPFVMRSIFFSAKTLLTSPLIYNLQFPHRHHNNRSSCLCVIKLP